MIRVQPQPHRELALAEDDDVAHARDAFQRIANEPVEVVADEQRVVAVVLREEPVGAQEPAGVLGDGDAVRAHIGRHAAERLIHAILHVNSRQIRVAANLEDDVDRGEAGVGARRGHVEHALDAVDHLFERRGDRAFHGLRIGAGVERRHGYRRRRQLGIPRDGQRRNRHRPGEHDDERANGGQDRPANEELAEHLPPLSALTTPGRLTSGCRGRRLRHGNAIANLLDA